YREDGKTCVQQYSTLQVDGVYRRIPRPMKESPLLPRDLADLIGKPLNLSIGKALEKIPV
ncbi:MAG: hypothetical protein ACLP02_21140, partial [Rhodomicrobium sp.]